MAAAEDSLPKLPLSDQGRWIWENHYPKGLDWNAPIAAKPLYALLDDAAQKYGAQVAADFLGKTWSYRDFASLSDRIARGLQQRGVKRGVKVGLFLPNSFYSIAFYFGILKAGGTVVNFNPLYVEREIFHQIADSGTEIMVTTDLALTANKMADALRETRLRHVIVCPFAGGLPFPKNLLFPLVKRKDIARRETLKGFDTWAELIRNDGRPATPAIDPEEDIAVLQYTGGTTGVPKGAALSHANIYANIMQTSLWMKGAEPGKDSLVGVLPFFHVFAMTAVMGWSLHNGVKILLQPKFDVKDVMELIKKHRPAFFPAVPAIFNAIANHKDVGGYDFSCLKYCMSGGAPLPADVKRLFGEKTGVSNLVEGYGLTETSPVVTINPVDGRAKAGSIGQPVPQTVVEIIDRETGQPATTGVKGEVCVRGPQVMLGYYNQSGATAEVMKSGRLHTGDVGYMDDEGFVYLVDRIKDLIIVRGYNVYPRVVEEAIYQHPDVEECIVAGVPDPERGETVRAWVVPAAGAQLTEDKLHHFLEDRISPIEMPRKIVIRAKPLPKTAVGKLSRKDLLIEEGIKK